MPPIPDFVHFPNLGAPRLHFMHANGYSPQAYLEMPVLFLRAELTDAFFDSTVRKIQRRLPKAESIEITGATHLFPLERPEETAALIKGFIHKAVSYATNGTA